MQVKRLFIPITVLFCLLLPSFSQAQKQDRPIVRLIYFLPRDRQPQPDIDEKLDWLIKGSQQLYADQMEAHGFGRKTFLFQTDGQGKAVVHHFVGQFTDAHYSSLSSTWDVWEEIDKRFDTFKNIYVTMIDMSSELLDTGGVRCEGCGGIGGRGVPSGPTGGKVLFTVFTSAEPNVISHELAHAFGLRHDIRENAKRISRFTTDSMLNSFCAAEWLDMHHAFNPGRTSLNQNMTIKLSPPSLASPPNAIRLRFEVTDPDGIHQAQLFTEARLWDDRLLRDCEQLNGNLRNTLEFVTRLTPKDESVYLNVMDVHGNITWRGFPIEITPLLPPSEIVSIPDKNLASAVQEAIGNSVTTYTMLNLVKLDVRGRQITDLTGLEHAHDLRSLDLAGNAVSDFSPLAGLTQLVLELNDSSISDVSPLAGLTQLRSLGLNNNSISDASPLTGLTQLRSLGLNNNSISDASPLAGLTQLTQLWLNNNSIPDASPLAGLTQLTVLGLNNNSISDASPLAGLTQLTVLGLNNNFISDVSPLAGLTQLRSLRLNNNSILDVSPLSGLTQLTELWLDNNSILDVSPLSGLTQLTELWLGNNSISDVSPLAGLTQLTVLGLINNSISDVSPLSGLNLTGTKGQGLWGVTEIIVKDSTGLYLQRNPLSYTSINTHIPAMQAREIEVAFDDRVHPAVLKISGDAQAGAARAALTTPFVVEVQDEQGKPMKGMSVTFAITAGGGQLSATTATTNAAGRAQTTLTLGRTPGTNTVRATANGIPSFVTFNAIVGDPPMYWVDAAKGTLHRRTRNKVETLIPSVRNATSLAVDVIGSKLYWTERTSDRTGNIRRANLDGSNAQLVEASTSVPLGIAIDAANGKIYLTNSWGKVQRLNVNGSNFQPNLITGLDAPKAIAVDTIGGKVYWTEKTSDRTGNIRRANLDGSNIQLVKALTSVPLGIAVDAANGKIYLTNSWGKVQWLNVDGSNFRPNFITGLDAPQDIAVDVAGGKLYWTEAGSIRRADLSGENIQDVVAGLGTPASIVLGVAPVGPAMPAAPAVLTVLPEATGLLPNYPNPFNPETWIPYQLAKPAEVTLHIYSVNGTLVQTLALGHQPAGMYRSKSRAAYWDGRNAQGEKVASGIYFYTLSAGDFTLTRKMLIRK